MIFFMYPFRYLWNQENQPLLHHATTMEIKNWSLVFPVILSQLPSPPFFTSCHSVARWVEGLLVRIPASRLRCRVPLVCLLVPPLTEVLSAIFSYIIIHDDFCMSVSMTVTALNYNCHYFYYCLGLLLIHWTCLGLMISTLKITANRNYTVGPTTWVPQSFPVLATRCRSPTRIFNWQSAFFSPPLHGLSSSTA